MIPVVMAFLRSYAPIIMFPVAVVIGVVGYNLENILSDKYTPPPKSSTEEARDDRQFEEMLNKTKAKSDSSLVDNLKDKKFVPQTIFEKNLSPQLRK